MYRRSRRFILLLVLFLFSSLAISAETTHKRVLYLGIAGNGPGQGAFGHAFIILSQNPGDFYESVAYQYNIVVPQDYKINPFNVYKLESFPFKVFAEPGFRFINHYTSQNRQVYLFQTTLPPDIVGKIQDDLEKEKVDREQNVRTDYKMSNSNCITKALDSINRYLPRNAQINYVPLADILPTFMFAGRERISASLPISAPLVLKRNALFSKEYDFKAVEVKNYERVLEQVNKIQALLGLCPTVSGMSTLLIRLSSNIQVSSSQAYFDLLKSQFNSCVRSNPKAKSIFVDLSDILRYDASDSVALHIDGYINELNY